MNQQELYEEQVREKADSERLFCSEGCVRAFAEHIET